MRTGFELSPYELMNTIKSLGEQSNKSYVIIDGEQSDHPIIYCNEQYSQLTLFAREQIDNQSFHQMLSNEQNIDGVEHFVESISSGQMQVIELFHNINTGYSFYARMFCLPFDKYYLLLVEDIAHKQLQSNSKQMNQQLEKGTPILKHLTEAIKNKEITVYFQPKVELYKERICSMEALARWISPDLGFVSPAEFIPVAESAGLVDEIDFLVIEQVFNWQQQRQFEGKRIVPIAVNISPDHFYHPLFVTQLRKLLQTYYVDPKFVIIEITENLGLVDYERARTVLNDLFLLGLRTSVDDFGIGFSSLSYLQKFVFHELKIDRSFICKLHERTVHMPLSVRL